MSCRRLNPDLDLERFMPKKRLVSPLIDRGVDEIDRKDAHTSSLKLVPSEVQGNLMVTVH